MQLYEAMFVVDNSKAREGLEAVQEEIAEAVKRQGGEMVNCDLWGERKLAYPVNRRKRGTFLLAHFNAPGEAIARLERAFRLSESILRVMVTVDRDGSQIVPPKQERPEFARGRRGEGRDGRDRDGRDRDGGGRDGRDRPRRERPGAEGAQKAPAPEVAGADNDKADVKADD